MNRLVDVVANAYGRQRQPISLVHFITRRCDARCAHCFIDFATPERRSTPLAVGEIERLAGRLGDSLVNVNITGGEPFLNRDIWPICRAYFQHAGVSSVYITTHGGFPERIAALADHFLATDFAGRLFISISIDNFAAAHDRNRRLDGLFARAVASHGLIKARANERIGVGVAITVAEHNYDQVERLYRMLRDDLGVEVITATLRRAQGVAAELPAALQARVGQAYAALTRRIEADLARQPRQGARRSFVARMQDAKDGILYALLREDAVRGSRYHSACPAGGLFVVLDADGEVLVCEQLAEARLGNVRDYGLDLRILLAAPPARQWRERIGATRCHCSYECALGINIVSNLRYLPGLAAGLLGGLRRG